eukprot:CAMPEP_0194289100 /NCGR_PEP_ID=MMETSP0169-20130528/38347_1 /TAXON_ID=218684 /ORGANISM="Corethron pennatum, Strain L29A3" /LENGTH=66 /DNA_ID=CAMNT_0039036293 /DNA_START=313 /DNA_END=510 /DNA_ORIENTATION=+
MVSLEKLQRIQQLQKYGNRALDAQKKYLGGGQHDGTHQGSASPHHHYQQPQQHPHSDGAPPRPPPG